MRCNPLRWLWGLLPLAVWLWITALSERSHIETDLTKRTQDALNAAGLSWASPSFNGRDGAILGRAHDDAEPGKALEVAKGVWGVRIANAQTELIEKVETYLWSASTRDGSAVRLSGYVPNEATRKTILGVVKANFPKSEIDDRMKLARGVPSQDTWLSGISFAAKQLASLKKGHVELSGTDLTVAGETETVDTYQQVVSAIRSKLPQGVKLVSEKVTPPVVSPYAWSAVHDGKEVVLSGYIPSDKAREEVVGLAKKTFGKVVDKMQLAEGAPDQLVRGTSTTLQQLARLKTGHAELKGNQLTLSGDAGDEASADSIRKAWKSGLPGSLKTSDALMYTKAPEPPAIDLTAKKAEEDAEARKAAEAKHAAAEAEARKAAEAKRAAEEAEARKAAEAKHAATEAEARKAAEAKRAADEAAAKERPKVAVVTEQRKAEAAKCQDTLRGVAKEGIIRFERASADLHSDSSSTLNKLASAANACPGFAVEIEGHTDAEGTPERNLRLSERRAQSVVSYLTKAGVPADRLRAIGYGETRPVAPNDTPENRSKNRRIEFGVKAE